jgi:putative protease
MAECDPDKKAELLAPAGNMDCFLAAVRAGADAVYLAGDKFGARAYADNFTTEQLCEAVRYGHLFQVKTYLTLNTLIKEREFGLLYQYVRPFYEAGLDGVIVQDFGVLRFLKRNFPGMEIHASTQMTVTGANGAALLKEAGVSRVVPARELSLEELGIIKEQTGMELEVFIHGAMCYAYSGQCLFSSVLGGRSGNRGRCAGPCRLPYRISRDGVLLSQRREEYPLSLKDLCTIGILPQLIFAGLDSFKIEGRMKSAEYVAIVTAIYRKYMDQVYELAGRYSSGEEVMKHYTVSDRDLYILQNLYVRTDLQEGYFYRHNGRELVTMQKPGYLSVSEKEIAGFAAEYPVDTTKKKIAVDMTVEAHIGHPLQLEAVPAADRNKAKKDRTDSSCPDRKVFRVMGAEVQKANNRSMTEEEIGKQLRKLGNTAFELHALDIRCDSDLFIPNKSLNELRRTAVDGLMDLLALKRSILSADDTKEDSDSLIKVAQKREDFKGLTVSVETLEQLRACLESERVSELFLSTDVVSGLLKEPQTEKMCRQKWEEKKMAVFIRLPRVMRRRAAEQSRKLLDGLGHWKIAGIVTNSLEGLAVFKDSFKECIADAGLYTFNKEACRFLAQKGISSFTVPYEASYHEQMELGKEYPFYYVIYGYLPLMESAGCVAKTMDVCRHEPRIYELHDRYHKTFYAKTHCERCENTIYNSVPMNLFGEWDRIKKTGRKVRLDFTIESYDKTKEVLQAFEDLSGGNGKYVPDYEFTKGYFKRGVE